MPTASHILPRIVRAAFQPAAPMTPPPAELEKVRVEGEKAAAEARALERRKRRRLPVAAVAVLGGDAKSGVTTAEAAACADQAVAALRDAISAGWNAPDELKEPDFDALRGRDDFKKLLAELETRNKAKAAKKEAKSK